MKTYAIIFPTNVHSLEGLTTTVDFSNILFMLFGKSICARHYEDKKIIEFYKFDDARFPNVGDTYYHISTYISGVIRKTKGHGKFLELHTFLNDQVEIKEDEDGQLMLTYGDYLVYASDRLKNYGVL